MREIQMQGQRQAIPASAFEPERVFTPTPEQVELVTGVGLIDVTERQLRVEAMKSAIAYGCAILTTTNVSAALDDKSIVALADEVLDWLKAGDTN